MARGGRGLDPAELERRARAGDWLTTGEVAVLFGVDRSTVHRWLKRDLLRWRESSAGPTSPRRTVHPGDVLGLLEQRRAVRGGGGG